MADEQDYVLGRGKVYFSRFKQGTKDPEGYRWLGNVTELNMNFGVDKLEHYASYAGIREKDASANTQVNRTGNFVTDNISPDNVALFFFGSTEALTISAASVTAEPLADVIPGLSYPLGVSQANPTGARAIIYPGSGGTAFAVKKGATTYTKGTDYDIDTETGFLTILEGGTIVKGDDLTIDYSVQASSRTRIISGSQSIEGALRYISDNPVGTNKDYTLPWVSLSPNGDYGLINQEWQTIPFSLEILKRTGYEALYVDGRPVVTP